MSYLWIKFCVSSIGYQFSVCIFLSFFLSFLLSFFLSFLLSFFISFFLSFLLSFVFLSLFISVLLSFFYSFLYLPFFECCPFSHLTLHFMWILKHKQFQNLRLGTWSRSITLKTKKSNYINNISTFLQLYFELSGAPKLERQNCIFTSKCPKPESEPTISLFL